MVTMIVSLLLILLQEALPLPSSLQLQLQLQQRRCKSTMPSKVFALPVSSKVWHRDDVDLGIEILQGPQAASVQQKPPLLFLHGSFHSAWCWSEYYFPYFQQLGYDCYAISMRGTASTGMPVGSTQTSVPIQDHVHDLSFVIDRIRAESTTKAAPVLVAHSFGGMVAMKLLERMYETSKSDTSSSSSLRLGMPSLSGVVLSNSVPPTGYRSMTMRTMKQLQIQKTWLILKGFVLKRAAADIDVCRSLFFCQEDCACVEESDLARYMQHFKEDSKIGTDVVALNKALPAITCMNTKNGKATWAEDSDVAHMLPKRLVLGGEEDFIVDSQALAETASYLGLHEAVQLPKVYHDFMLGKRWQAGADYIANWLASKSL